LILAGGFALGVIHCFDPDHIAAMSTLVARDGQRPASAFAEGAVWGIGHTLSLASFGLILVFLDDRVGGVWERVFEAGVGLLLIYLGYMRLRDVWRVPHLHAHRHGGLEHSHYHLHGRRVRHAAEEAHRPHSHAPLWIGVLHGFAGTAALMALLPAVIIDHFTGYVFYVLVFGLGCTLAMGAFCAGLGRFTGGMRDGRWLAGVAGSASLGLGFFWFGNAVAG
jgi:hypothetical protein